eukprot:TRINITY_DN6713_c0_g2_i1.p3 TRINITY_DN6713_c0_g2~~TRINITY_DN6713_c0_g2_i1.p3  ORF type:complete len:203 (-),score=3.43 TRINITY_DN6713_c0_g2_i1:986-1594(-)
MNMMGMATLAIVSGVFLVFAIVWCVYGLQHYSQREGQVVNESWFVGFGRSERSLQNIHGLNSNSQMIIQIQHKHENELIIQQLPLFVLRQLPDGGVYTLAEEECPICQEPFLAGEILTYLPCGHVFHYTSLVPWLTKNNHCPLCRQEVKHEYNTNIGQFPTSDVAPFLNCSGPFCYLPSPRVLTNRFPHISSVQSLQSEPIR